MTATTPLPSAMPRLLNVFLQNPSADEWLETMVACFNEEVDLTPISSAKTSCYVEIINALFFYKLNPQQLFEEVLHPEKLVSVTHRLSQLHCFLHRIYQNTPFRNYLVHQAPLPPGIDMHFTSEIRMLIGQAIAKLRIPAKSNEQKTFRLAKIREIFQVYKFWFEPSWLIDLVMVLRLDVLKEGQSDFYEEMRKLCDELTTTECLDLYGYFSNKDTLYLARTLTAIMEGSHFSWLFPLNDKEMQLVSEVTSALITLMNAVRDELTGRLFEAPAYGYERKGKKLEPSKRNQAAIQRLLILYGQDQTRAANESLETLFQKLEKSLAS